MTDTLSTPLPTRPGHELRPALGMRAHLWDLADEGAEEVIADLRAGGIDALHLALAGHGGRFVCPHNPKRVLVHAPDGVLYFRPELSCYESIKPRVHPEFGSGAFAQHVIGLCRDYEMAAVGSVVLFNNTSISQWHPEATCVNALGDRLEGALCPAHPAVRAYAQAMVEDLATRVEVDVIECEDFAYPQLEAYPGPLWRGLTLGPGAAFLLGLCFCRHCQQRAEEANIEVDDLERRIERMIRLALTGDLSERRLGDEISDPYHPLARYSAMRAETITSLLDELQDAVAGSPVALQPVLATEPDLAWRAGLELAQLRRLVHRATLLAPPCEAAAVQAWLVRYEELLHMGHDVTVDLRLAPLRTCGAHLDESAARALLHAVREAGYHRLILSHYGLAPLEQLEELLAAARPAQG